MLQLKTAVTLALAILPDAAQSFDTSDFLAATITPQSVALRLSMRSTPNIAIKQGVQNFYASQVIMGSDEKNLTSIYQDLVSKVLKYKEYPAWNSAVKSVIPKDEHDVTGQFEKNHTYTMWPTSSGKLSSIRTTHSQQDYAKPFMASDLPCLRLMGIRLSSNCSLASRSHGSTNTLFLDKNARQ
jgi:hypothetical protein